VANDRQQRSVHGQESLAATNRVGLRQEDHHASGSRGTRSLVRVGRQVIALGAAKRLTTPRTNRGSRGRFGLLARDPIDGSAETTNRQIAIEGSMVTHVVLMKPRVDLSETDRRAFVAAFQAAVREIPAIRGVRIGRRITHGAGYEQTSIDAADFLAALDFDDLAALQTYLRHPAHEALGVRFGQSLSAALVYDFEAVAPEDLGRI